MCHLAASALNNGDLQEARRVERYLRKVLVAWQGFPFLRSQTCHDSLLRGCGMGYRQSCQTVDKQRCRRLQVWGLQSLGEETVECRTLELGD